MTFTTSIAQKGVRIAYIDFNEIIEEISDYREAIQSLESKAQNWNKEIEIKNAIETIFKVKVNKINTSILRGKGKTFKGQYGFRKDIKKAIVTLDEGNTIDSSLEIK